jgi:hypothetical protein
MVKSTDVVPIAGLLFGELTPVGQPDGGISAIIFGLVATRKGVRLHQCDGGGIPEGRLLLAAERARQRGVQGLSVPPRSRRR